MSGLICAQQPAATGAVPKPNPHDMEVFLLEPKVVTPAEVGQPPSEAGALFEGHSLDERVSAQDSSWTHGDESLRLSFRDIWIRDIW